MLLFSCLAREHDHANSGGSPEIKVKGHFMSEDLFDRDRILGSAKNLGGRGLHAGLSTLGDFQKFILRGNVIDLAVGVVIGVAFNNLVQGFISDFLQPLIGASIAFFTNGNAQSFDKAQSGPFLWGHFVGLLISFLLTAAVVYFFVVKPTNVLQDRYERLRPKREEAPTTRECPFCLSTVPRAATRCAYCTAQLPPADDKASSGNFAPQR
jgi:large conductance mechanosensitive channel